jgi:hypothetical protein
MAIERECYNFRDYPSVRRSCHGVAKKSAGEDLRRIIFVEKAWDLLHVRLHRFRRDRQRANPGAARVEDRSGNHQLGCALRNGVITALSMGVA